MIDHFYMLSDTLLSTSIEYLKGVGADRAALLHKELNIRTYEDLLWYFPFRYVDKTSIHRIADLNERMPYCQVVGKIGKVSLIGKGTAKRLTAMLSDDTGTVELVWFKGIPVLQKIIQPGLEFLVFGKPSEFKGRVNIVHPELESVTKEVNLGGKSVLQPVYPSTEKLKAKNLDSKGISKLMRTLLEKLGENVHEVMPEYLVKQLKLMPRSAALHQIHFPTDMDKQKAAENRLKFEELLFIQLKLLRLHHIRKQDIKGHVFEKVGNYVNSFYNNHLPFDLTGAQKRVIKEIRQDVRSGKQMNRLLQGDVGSGKTIVALMAMLMALDNGMEACMMAPTEILATQHFHSITRFTEELNIPVKLLTGSTKKSVRKEIEAGLASGTLPIVIGTHALLENWVTFPKLGLVVIDEQHRFGVAQRSTMWKKNIIPPHILVMTATPIPRTLAMTLYGDLDISVIDEMPPGRKDIVTRHVFENKRLEVFGFMKKEIAKGRQVYVVYPLIEESETLDYNNLMAGFEAIEREFPKPEYQVSIVHGRMASADKEFEMQRFKRGDTQILVSTTVIEVGVDVPNATIMLIESAEKFGLSQLHQLRGRVGRGGNQSYCILMTGYKLSEDAKVRMETMARTNNGFEISEVDLRLRGPGDLAGTQQSGMLDLKIANLISDQKILGAARHVAMDILNDDPTLSKPENKPLMEQLDHLNKVQTNWSIIS
jgi:ATP-dependent DNA helicase RecG